jgi:hypothetical protein
MHQKKYTHPIEIEKETLNVLSFYKRIIFVVIK